MRMGVPSHRDRDLAHRLPQLPVPYDRLFARHEVSPPALYYAQELYQRSLPVRVGLWSRS